MFRSKTATDGLKAANSSRSLARVVALFVVGALLGGQVFLASCNDYSTSSSTSSATSSWSAPAGKTYTFRSNKALKEHYQKHGKNMGFADAQAYVAAANKVINNPDSLHKFEKEDGDDVYYLQATDEIVFVSTDGYIRTYFNPGGIDYFNRQ